MGWLFAPFFWLTPRLPLRMLRAISAFGGRILYIQNRRAADERIRRSLGIDDPKEIDHLVRSCCRSAAETTAESLYVTHRGPGALEELIDPGNSREELARFDRELETGWIGVTGHIGNWELLASWISSLSASPPTLVIAKRATNPHLNRYIERLRTNLGLETLYQDDPATRAVRALRDKRVVGVVPDQDVKTLSGVFVDFLGHPAYTPVGPARLAIAARAPIICCFMVREPNGRLRPIIGEPIWPDPSLPRPEQLIQLTKAWSAEVEAMVRRHPEQWPWIHDRWKTTPEKLEARGRKRL